VWANMRKYLPPKCHATRIENRTGGGIADVHVCDNGVSFWVELKASNSEAPVLRPSQAAWHMRQAACGGLSYVLCGFTRSPRLRIWRGFEAALAGSAGLLCAPTLFETDDMAEALRLLREDALRETLERCLAAARSLPATEKTPDP